MYVWVSFICMTVNEPATSAIVIFFSVLFTNRERNFNYLHSFIRFDVRTHVCVFIRLDRIGCMCMNIIRKAERKRRDMRTMTKENRWQRRRANGIVETFAMSEKRLTKRESERASERYIFRSKIYVKCQCHRCQWENFCVFMCKCAYHLLRNMEKQWASLTHEHSFFQFFDVKFFNKPNINFF